MRAPVLKMRVVRVVLRRTLEDVAIQTRISIGRLSAIERGSAIASEDERQLIAMAFGLPSEQLFSAAELANIIPGVESSGADGKTAPHA